MRQLSSAGHRSGRLNGRLALITGASSGIGAATARRFVAEGARVVLVARRAELLEELAGELAPEALALPADVSSYEEVAAAVQRASEWLGGIDVVVNGAGVSYPIELSELDPQTWRSVIDINLSGAFYVAREAGLRMLAGAGGTIINVGSELSETGQRRMVAYCASKAGVLGLTRALAMELAPTVRVNAICPGPVDTPMMDAEFAVDPDPEASRRATVDRTPLGRMADPDEIAAAIVFMVADAAFMTGAALQIDGGTTTVLRGGGT